MPSDAGRAAARSRLRGRHRGVAPLRGHGTLATRSRTGRIARGRADAVVAPALALSTTAAWHQACSIGGVTMLSHPRSGDSMLQATPRATARADVAVLLNAHAKQVNARRPRRPLRARSRREPLLLPRATTRPTASPTPWSPRRLSAPSSPAAATGPSSPGSTASSTGPRAPRRPRPASACWRSAPATPWPRWSAPAAPPRRRPRAATSPARSSPGRRLDLVTCEGRRTPFAGVGIDAAVLNDYNWLQGRGWPDTPLGRSASGLRRLRPGRRAPLGPARSCWSAAPTYCEIVNTGRPAWRLDGRGRARRPRHRPRRAALRRPLHDGRRQHRPLLRPRAAGLPLRRGAAPA